MSFFKDLKEDMSEALSELEQENLAAAPEEELSMDILDEMVNTLDEEAPVAEMQSGLLDGMEDLAAELEAPVAEPVVADPVIPEPEVAAPVSSHMAVEKEPVADEIAEITRGMSVEGNIKANGGINLNGKVRGNVEARGKLSINGEIVGNSTAGEIFTNNAKISGDVRSESAVKIGNGTIIIGNVYGTSAVIAGAVKGTVDINGPVIVDSTAIIQGDLLSASVQLNNGAVIDGRVSQCYANVDYQKLFDESFAM